jgi:hypothetical protein
MIARIPWRGIACAVSLTLLLVGTAPAQSSSSTSETQFDPEIDAHVQLPSDLRLLGLAGVQDGVGYPYQQWYAAAALGFQSSRIETPHLLNIDPDKEFHLVLGVGYEYLKTTQTGSTTSEDRVTLELTPGSRFAQDVLVRDRNRVELRWVDGRYSTTYRNMLSVEWDRMVAGLRFAPYGTVEAFYDGSKHAWNEWWYTAGVEFPFGRRFMVDTYYRRESCRGCTPPNWNVAGLTLNYFCDVPKRQY